MGKNIINRDNLSPFAVGVVISSGLVFCLLAFFWPNAEEKAVKSIVPAEEIIVPAEEPELVPVAEPILEQESELVVSEVTEDKQELVISRLENKLLSVQEQLAKEQEARRNLELKLKELTNTNSNLKPKIKSIKTSSHTSAEKHILDMPSRNYTLQLLASADEQEIKDFIRTHNLARTAYYVKSSYQGKPWYILLSGNYSSRNSAEAALESLPHKLKKIHPWPREFVSIQRTIKKN